MRWRLWLLPAAVSIAGWSCASTDSVEKVEAHVKKVERDITVWVKDSLPHFTVRLVNAVCQLEAKNPQGLDPTLRACKPGDTVTQPKYPPP